MVGDAGFARSLARCERVTMAPQNAYWRNRAAFEVDVRDLLGAIRVPTLVLVRAGSAGYEQGRYVAEHIDGARYVELPGLDDLFFVGDTGRSWTPSRSSSPAGYLVLRSTGCWPQCCSPTW